MKVDYYNFLEYYSVAVDCAPMLHLNMIYSKYVGKTGHNYQSIFRSATLFCKITQPFGRTKSAELSF